MFSTPDHNRLTADVQCHSKIHVTLAKDNLTSNRLQRLKAINYKSVVTQLQAQFGSDSLS